MKKNQKIMAPVLTDAQRQQLAQNLAPIRKDEAAVYRGNERTPLASIRCPAFARILMHGANLIKTCASRRNLETEFPAALRFHKGQIPGMVVAEPLAKYDRHAPDQFELKWSDDKVTAALDMLPILQPRNMAVAEGYVMETPMSLEQLGQPWYLIFHLGEAVTREEEEGTPRTKKKGDASAAGQKPAAKSETTSGDDQNSSEAQSAAGNLADEADQ